MGKLTSELQKGAWSSLTEYTPGDYVSLSGSSYVCVLTHTNQTPPNATYWALVAQAGTNGTNGVDGEVLGPASATDSAIALFDGTSGEVLKDSATTILDEDTMSSNSATAVASQQSIKAYVDAEIAGVSQNTDGWITSDDTWVYVSASTFTITGVDRTAQLQVGTKLKFTQTTTKYAVVVAVSFSSDTTVTIAVNTDYTIANAAITNPYYSYQTIPQGYPEWFDVAAPTFDVTYLDDGAAGQPTVTENRMKIEGRQVTIHLRGTGTKATSNAFYSLDPSPTYPTIANTSQRTALGSWYSIGASDHFGLIYYYDANVLYCYHHSSITDNQAITFGGTFTYEI